VQTDCTPGQLEFQGFGRRQVVAAFDGGRQTSDGGVLLLREIAEQADRGHALAGRSTLNRLELTPVDVTAASR